MTGHKLPGVHDDAAAANDGVLRAFGQVLRDIGRIVGAAQGCTGESTKQRPSKATCRGRAIKLDALGVERGPQQRHVVLPADGRSDLSWRRVEDSERSSSDEAFHGGRHDLAMLRAFGRDRGTLRRDRS